MSTSERSNKLAEQITRTWNEDGLDKIEEFKYNIYLSYPKAPAEIIIWDGSSVEKKLVISSEPPIDATENTGRPEELWPYFSFSPAGDVKVGRSNACR